MGEKAVVKAAKGGNTESLNSEMLSLNFAWKLIFTKGAFIKEIEVLYKREITGAYNTGHLKQQ